MTPVSVKTPRPASGRKTTPEVARAHQALDRAVELWHEVDTKRRDVMARGRTASSDIARSWKETLRESRASLSAARQEWREAARLLARTPEQTELV
ncbi:MAG TPA: hypothetical protein VEO37_08020 [Thermoanaerobaculia bacterium]|nr:hypothetical protein [Thermoanaerobaculia bacterium]